MLIHFAFNYQLKSVVLANFYEDRPQKIIDLLNLT